MLAAVLLVSFEGLCLFGFVCCKTTARGFRDGQRRLSSATRSPLGMALINGHKDCPAVCAKQVGHEERKDGLQVGVCPTYSLTYRLDRRAPEDDHHVACGEHHHGEHHPSRRTHPASDVPHLRNSFRCCLAVPPHFLWLLLYSLGYHCRLALFGDSTRRGTIGDHIRREHHSPKYGENSPYFGE